MPTATVDLTKWPRLLVTGDPVTEEQANEILIRTDDWWISGNDRAFTVAVAQVAAEFGRPLDTFGRAGEWAAVRDWCARMGVLDLCYLNNHRVMSAWIGGPHGWCDWAGRIGCANYNIGKDPSVEAVHDDWTAIAEAFPFLHLRAQLVPDEGEAPHPAVEWLVRGGKAHLVESIGLLAPPHEFGGISDMRGMFIGGERGVTLDRLRAALAQVAADRGVTP